MFHRPFKLNLFFIMNCTFVNNNKKCKNKLYLDRSTFIYNLMSAFIFPKNVNELI